MLFWEQPVLIEDGLYSFNIANYSIPTLDGGLDRRNFASVPIPLLCTAGFPHCGPWPGSAPPWSGRCTPEARSGTRHPPDRGNGATAPPSTLTDVSFEKDFGLGQNTEATTFLEVRNLFGQRDDTGTGFRWIQYGLQKPPPGDSKFDNFGDISELTRYNGGLGRPRAIVAGARFKF